MRKKKIINAFDYLIGEYDCSLSFEEIRGANYIFQNDVFKLKIYVWEQFDELDINLMYNGECFRINPYDEDHSLLAKRKGIKGFFFNFSDEYWDIVAKIVRDKIKSIIK